MLNEVSCELPLFLPLRQMGEKRLKKLSVQALTVDNIKSETQAEDRKYHGSPSLYCGSLSHVSLFGSLIIFGPGFANWG